MISYLFVLNGRVSHFPILGKNFPQFHLIIIRECPQNSITLILRYFYNFSLIPFIQTPLTALIYSHTHTHTHTWTHIHTQRVLSPIFNNKRVLSFYAVQILQHHFQYEYTSLFLFYNKTYFSKYTKIFERKIQPHEMLKSLCKSAAAPTAELFNSVPRICFDNTEFV